MFRTKLEMMQDEVVEKLGDLEAIFPPAKFELTFLARYIKSDLPDADVLITASKFEDIVSAVERRKRVATGVKVPTVRQLYDAALNRRRELAEVQWDAEKILLHLQSVAELGVFRVTLPVCIAEEAAEKLLDDLDLPGLEVSMGCVEVEGGDLKWRELDLTLVNPEEDQAAREAFEKLMNDKDKAEREAFERLMSDREKGAAKR